jgi:uncharacterized damage-inducible protein DinB
MGAPAIDAVSELQLFRQQARMAHQVVRLNIEGLTHEQSLIQPRAGGNCLNWIVGHLVWVYAGALPMLQQEPPIAAGPLSRYARGAPPLRDPAEARDFAELVAAWDEANRRVDAGLADLPADALGRPAPHSPSNNPNETIRSLLATICFHQAYHAGQTGVLRRVIGRPGAIA